MSDIPRNSYNESVKTWLLAEYTWLRQRDHERLNDALAIWDFWMMESHDNRKGTG